MTKLLWQKVALAATTVMVTLVGTTTVGTASAQADNARAKRVPAVTFKVASFNILGSQHTAQSRRWAPGASRARLARQWLDAEGVSVTGVSEGQRDQMLTLTEDRAWRAFPSPQTSTNSQTAQSVAWRHSEWQKVDAETFRIPFYFRQTREQPMVLLEHRATGQRLWVIEVHLTVGRGQRAIRERRVGTRRLAAQVRRLEPTGVPVIVTGDMNDRSRFFCQLTGSTALSSPIGGSNLGGVCTPPWGMRVDWLFGSPEIGWFDFRFAGGGVLDRVTDHVVPVAHATLPAR